MPKSWLVRNAESAERARRRIELSGLTPGGHPVWDKWEVSPLVAHHPDYPFILPMVDRRTNGAVHSKASRLGITRRHAPPWSENELLRLRKMYPKGTRQEILGAFPGRTYEAVAQMANKRGIYRAPRPLNPTGCKVLDQILNRARERRVSLAVLGAEAGHINYFTGRQWRSGRYNWKAHWLAIRYLEGTLRARFPDKHKT